MADSVRDVIDRFVSRLRVYGQIGGFFLNDANVEAVAEEDPERGQHGIFAQVVYLGSTRPHAVSGVGLLTGTIRLVVFSRANQDVDQGDTERIKSQTVGLMRVLDAIEGDMVHSYLDGYLLIPLTIAGSSNTSAMPTTVRPGLVRASIDFNFGIDLNYVSVQVKSDGTTPDKG